MRQDFIIEPFVFVGNRIRFSVIHRRIQQLAIDLSELPTLEIPGQFISQHANAADYAIYGVSSKHCLRTYKSRLRSVAQLLGYDDLRKVPWDRLRYEHVLQIREYL